MEGINTTAMEVLSTKLNVALGDANRLLSRQMEFSFRHFVNKCFYSSEGKHGEEYLYFLDAFRIHDNVLLSAVRVYKHQDEKLSWYYIESTHKGFKTIAERFKKKFYKETSYSSFEEAYTKACKQISEDMRIVHTANAGLEDAKANFPTNENEGE